MRGFFVLPLALGAAALGRAAEGTAAPAPATESSLSAAKRDFDSIKASREEALHPKADLPRLTVPELQLSTPAPRAPASERDNETAPGKKAKSANWLVDAMEKGETKSDLRGRNGKGSTGKYSDPAKAWGSEKSANPTDFTPAPDHRRQTSSESQERREVEPPPNPLAPFLAGWMTARDYALLKPSATPGSAATSASPVALPGIAASAPDSVFSLRPDVRTPFRGDGPSRLAPAPAGNPYLSAMNDPVPPSGALALPVRPVTAMPTPAPVRYEPAPPPPPVKIPDFARPESDDRYFKPLKRF